MQTARPPKPLIVTNCTGRKRHPALDGLTARSLTPANCAAVAAEWVDRVQSAHWRFPANTLYCGRAVTETFASAESTGAEVAFLSAGMGVVRRFSEVPAYNLTATPGYPDSVSQVVSGAYRPDLWWSALCSAMGQERPLTKLVADLARELILLAMPTSYVSMVAEELVSWCPTDLRRLRIVGPRHADQLPTELRACVMPYDTRLDSAASGFNGTASDFPHRALRHFVQEVLPGAQGKSLEEHRKRVKKALSSFKSPVRIRGRSASDDEVRSELTAMWKTHGGRRGLMLRELRSKRLIACEQSRFKSLANQVEIRINGANKK